LNHFQPFNLEIILNSPTNHNNQSHHIHLNIAKQGKYCKMFYEKVKAQNGPLSGSWLCGIEKKEIVKIMR